MPQPDDPADDLCDRLLEPSPTPACTEQQRELVLRETLRVLHARRRRRRLRIAAALAASFAAGMLAMHLWPAAPKDVEEAPAVVKRPDPPRVVPMPQPEPRPEEIAAASRPDPTLPAPVLERLAELAGPEVRAEHFLLAGKSYEHQGDLPAALRCYRQALEPGGIDLAIAEGDSYLLMVLKNARQKEKRHANKDT